ncbi:LOW QUALITY PROTEIN: hypothetical protein PHMEG_00030802 [Phytophthora megakarya]|uniref:Reverse transcriptase n=1 Tax=Phytophthora megakarya TaxID=4795 RepID=A0A225UZP9_9STRA|nr:LOW QUALITY PROTEIN: hypothetical protein PHMEG_00030802 [Phytophthora megakarya]
MEQTQVLAGPTLNSINVRDLQSAVLAALMWGPTWATAPLSRRPTHVCFWIDNTSAVSWAQSRSSRHPLALLYNRLLSLAEFNYSLSCTAEHIPGCDNTVVDAGSRAWAPSHPLFLTWTNLSSGWTQVSVEHTYNNLSELWERCSGTMLSLTLPLPNTDHMFCKFMSWSPWLRQEEHDPSLTLNMFTIYCCKYGWNGKGNKFQSIQLKVSSIRWFHRRFLQFEPSLSSDFEVLMRDIRRPSEPIQKNHLVTPAFLRLMCRRLNIFFSPGAVCCGARSSWLTSFYYAGLSIYAITHYGTRIASR